MKKSIKKIVSAALSFTIMLAGSIYISAAENNEEFFKNQDIFVPLYQSMIEKVDANDYGGAYLDESGVLNVNLLEHNTRSSDRVRDVFSKESGVIYHENATYSYSELQEMCSFGLREYWDEYNITGIGVNDQYNRLDIFIPYSSEDEAKALTESLSKIIAYDMFEIINYDATIDTSPAPIIEMSENEVSDENRAATRHNIINGNPFYNEMINTSSVGCGVVWDKSTSVWRY